MTTQELTEIKAGGDWLEVPGWPYLINKATKQFFACRTGRILGPSNSDMFCLQDCGRKICATKNKIIYAAQKGIDPSRIDGRKYRVFLSDSGLKLMETSAYLAKREREFHERRKAASRKSDYDIETEYREHIDFCRKCLKGIQTGEWGEVVAAIENCKPAMYKYIRKVFYFKSDQNVEDIWVTVSGFCLDAILNKTCAVGSPCAYMKRCVMTEFRNMKERRKRKLFEWKNYDF